MISAIEIYNKPDFKYREETFAILAINSWVLLLKARWLKDNDSKIRSLYVLERANKKDGSPSKKIIFKTTSCGNPFTHSLEYLAKKLEENKTFDSLAKQNIDALREIRDSSVHFYNRNTLFAIRLQEVGSACVKNFVQATKDWFETDLSRYNFYLMPLAFVKSNVNMSLIDLNKEEANLVRYISELDSTNDSKSDYSVSVNVELTFSKSKTKEALAVQFSNDPTATKIQFTDEQFKSKYPLNYKTLTEKCRLRYENFIENQTYHTLRKSLLGDSKFCGTKKLDSDNPKSLKKDWYSEAVLNFLDNHYIKNIN